MNRLREIWAAGGTALNGWLAVPSAYSAELMALGGYDSLVVDLQHGLQDYGSALAAFQTMGAHRAVPLARLLSNDVGMAGKLLDAGAAGLICPMVNTAAEAAQFVAACRYPPVGVRSNGALRAGLYGAGGDWQAQSNADVLCIPMIETVEAVDNIDAILAVPGVDAFYVGPTDLRLSMGLPAVMDGDEPEVLAVYDRLLASAKAHGVVPGLHCVTAEYAVRAAARGFRFVTAGYDAGYVLAGARADNATFRAR